MLGRKDKIRMIDAAIKGDLSEVRTYKLENPGSISAEDILATFFLLLESEQTNSYWRHRPLKLSDQDDIISAMKTTVLDGYEAVETGSLEKLVQVCEYYRTIEEGNGLQKLEPYREMARELEEQHLCL